MYFAPDYVTQAEDRHAERLERREADLEKAAAELAAEYMACTSLPLLSTLHCPTDLNPRRRLPFLDVFVDDLYNEAWAARVVACLARSDEGKKLLQEMADKHGETYAEDVQ